MMILFQIGEIVFDFGSLIAFLIGIVVGILLLFLIYSVLVVSSLKSKKYIAKGEELIVTDTEVKEVVDNARKLYTDKKIKGAKDNIGHCFAICTAMVTDIARKFFPKSKRPVAELTVDELLQLAIYISNRIDEIIDRPALRLVKKVKLSTILGLGDVKKAIDDSSLMKLTKKYKVKKFFDTVLGVLNIFNPVYWIRRTVMTSALDLAVNKLCILIIGIVAEETYKIYSKRVFEEERYIDTNVNELVESIEKDLEGLTDEEVEEYLATQGLSEKLKKKRKGK